MIHALFNIAGISALQVLRDIWLVELAIAVTALSVFALVVPSSVKYLKQLRYE